MLSLPLPEIVQPVYGPADLLQRKWQQRERSEPTKIGRIHRLSHFNGLVYNYSQRVKVGLGCPPTRHVVQHRVYDTMPDALTNKPTLLRNCALKDAHPISNLENLGLSRIIDGIPLKRVSVHFLSAADSR